MAWPVQLSFLSSRSLTFSRNLRFACPTWHVNQLNISQPTRRSFSIAKPSVTGRQVTATTNSRWPLSEAERLLEEQIRLLEAEREESLSIARQCTTRSKRLVARLENLRDYEAKAVVARRRSVIGTPTTAARGQGTWDTRWRPNPGPDSSSQFGSAAGAGVRPAATATATASGSESSRGPPPEASGELHRRHRAVGGSDVEDQSSPVSTGDQTRRLVSRALRRNVSRGENNLALAEKLQQYIGLLRNELACVRQGDVSLATKIVDAHRARTTAAAASASVTASSPPAPDSPEEMPVRQYPSGSRGTAVGSVGTKVPDAKRSRPFPSPSPSPSSTATKSGATARGRQGGVRDMAAKNTAEKGSSSSGSSSSGSSSSGSSSSYSDSGETTGPSHLRAEGTEVDSRKARETSSSATSCNSSNNTGSGGGDGSPDAASGLGRIFSRSRVLELPGDDTMAVAAATMPTEQAAAQGGGPSRPPSAVKRKGPSPGKSSKGPPPHHADVNDNSDADMIFHRSSETKTPAGAPPLTGQAASPTSSNDPEQPGAFSCLSSSAAVAPDLDPDPEHGDRSAVIRDGGGGGGSPAVRSETTADDYSGSICSANNEDNNPFEATEAAAAAADLGLSLEAARSLAEDSEDARTALMGLLSPAGLLPGPLQQLGTSAAATATTATAAAGSGSEKKSFNDGGSGDSEGTAGSGRDGGVCADGAANGTDAQHSTGTNSGADLAEVRLCETMTAAVLPPPSPPRLGLYALSGEQVPSRTTCIQAPSASAAAAKAETVMAAAMAAAAAAECMAAQGQPGVHGGSRSTGGNTTSSPAARELRALVALLGIMVSELRRRGYMGCEEHVELVAAQLDHTLAVARAEAAAAGTAATSSRRGLWRGG